MSPFRNGTTAILNQWVSVIFWDGWNLKIRYPQHLQAFVLVFSCFLLAKHNMAVSTSSLVHGCPVDRRSVGFIQNWYIMIQNCGLARMAPDPVDAVAILSALRVLHPGTWTAQWTGSFFFFFKSLAMHIESLMVGSTSFSQMLPLSKWTWRLEIGHPKLPLNLQHDQRSLHTQSNSCPIPHMWWTLSLKNADGKLGTRG